MAVKRKLNLKCVGDDTDIRYATVKMIMTIFSGTEWQWNISNSGHIPKQNKTKCQKILYHLIWILLYMYPFHFRGHIVQKIFFFLYGGGWCLRSVRIITLILSRANRVIWMAGWFGACRPFQQYLSHIRTMEKRRLGLGLYSSWEKLITDLAQVSEKKSIGRIGKCQFKLLYLFSY